MSLPAGLCDAVKQVRADHGGQGVVGHFCLWAGGHLPEMLQKVDQGAPPDQVQAAETLLEQVGDLVVLFQKLLFCCALWNRPTTRLLP